MSLCDVIGFPTEHAFSTQLDLDECQLTTVEVELVRRKAAEILRFPMIPEAGREIGDEAKQTVEALDRIFEVLSTGGPGELMKGVEPVGGEEKAKRVSLIVERLQCRPEAVIYVGDSITDVEAFRMVREKGGLTVSFNGNRYAVENAEIAVVSRTAEVLKDVVSRFTQSSKKGAIELAQNWDNSRWPRLFVVTSRNLKPVTQESVKVRRDLRGERIGALG
jgi:predicted HAD superfamily phosphohydrolase